MRWDGSVSRPVASFDISAVEPSGSAPESQLISTIDLR